MLRTVELSANGPMPDSAVHSVAKSPPPLWEIEWQVCAIAAHQCGVERGCVSPQTRLIEDLHCDSLDLVELVMELEDTFGVVIPNEPTNDQCKSLFTRQPLRLGDLAELVVQQWGTGERRRTETRKRPPTMDVTTSALPFLQLDGVLHDKDAQNSPLYETLPLTRDGQPQYRRQSDGMRCMLIPGADVFVGSDEREASQDEQPVHRLHLDSFLIDAEPVSTTAYARFLNSVQVSDRGVLREWFELDSDDARQIHAPLRLRRRRWSPVSGTEQQPMMLVSWFGANAYSLWANRADWRRYRWDGSIPAELQQYGVKPVPSSDDPMCVSCLPSEAQWEYAARGPMPRRYPWGDEDACQGGDVERARVSCHRRGATYEVETFPAAPVSALLGMSPFGLHHMAGNVWQWCADWYDPAFYRSPEACMPNARNGHPTGLRSERGGSWVGPESLARSSYRRGRNPLARGRCLGFRCMGSAADTL